MDGGYREVHMVRSDLERHLLTPAEIRVCDAGDVNLICSELNTCEKCLNVIGVGRWDWTQCDDRHVTKCPRSSVGAC